MKRLIPINYENQRIMTTKVLAEEFGTEEKNIQMNFTRNHTRFIEDKHFYKLEGQNLKDFKDSLPTESREPIKFAPVLYLWTDRGAARHAKILDTDEAWEVYEELEETYFNPKIQVPKLSKELQAIFAIDGKQQELEVKVEVLKDDIEGMRDNMPLFNVECKELQALVRKVGIKALGGYKSPAYNDSSLRCRIYQDIQQQLKREFGVTRYEAIKRCQLEKATLIVNNYTIPFILQEVVTEENNQMKFGEVI